jgi:hypothetical protein
MFAIKRAKRTEAVRERTMLAICVAENNAHRAVSLISTEGPNSPAKATSSAAAPEQPPVATIKEVMEQLPPHSVRTVPNLFERIQLLAVELPQNLTLHCESEICEGPPRRHVYGAREALEFDDFAYVYCVYRCANCIQNKKIFGLKCQRHASSRHGICTKIYQEPTFGEPIPPKLFDVIGKENREHFLNARRAIARSLGIGAFAYYRRIVEDHKFNLVSSILKVAEATRSSAAQIELLKKAQKETRFTKAIAILHEVNAIPATLLVDGHNPLLLLHDLLSEGIHELDDTNCLHRARTAEVILFAIADRLQFALTEQKTLKDAITSALNVKK